MPRQHGNNAKPEFQGIDGETSMGVSDASNQSCSNGEPAIDALARLLPVVVLSDPSARLSIEMSTILTPSIEEQSDAIARRLSRTRARHVLLTGSRGVGKTTLVWRLAHLVGSNRYPFLEASQFLWADCTNVGPEDSRACLESLFGIATGTDVPRVLCVDGLAALLKRPNGGSNKPLL
ncbi:MAG: ATP-binding protein, partial [Planctomycetaceae bacterium]|nr:ATP-binding protein [Planctomycetaceae bacterium]